MARGRRTWLYSLVIMALAMGALTALVVTGTLLLPGAAWLYEAGMWGLIPLAGAACAFRATRRGLNNYASWAVPPVCQTAVHWALVGYPPQSAGMPLVTAGVSLVAAAAAQVLNEREEKAHKGGGR